MLKNVLLYCNVKMVLHINNVYKHIITKWYIFQVNVSKFLFAFKIINFILLQKIHNFDLLK